jgi:hypothetical protein
MKGKSKIKLNRLCEILTCAAVAATIMMVASCAVLTKSQLQLVTNLSASSDSVAITPAVIFDELAKIRLERGLYYAASLASATAREKEINALATAYVADEGWAANRANVYVNVLNGYLRALRSISADNRWGSYGVEWRGIGRNVDSLMLRLNQTDLLETELPVGWAKLSGQYAGYMSENYMRNRQARMVRTFVTDGDTLVATCIDELVELLKKDGLDELIKNEEEGLHDNYKAYLNRLEVSGEMADLSEDRRYVELVKRMETVKKTRSRCVTALQSLRRAHKKLVKELEKRKKTEYIYEELLELNTLALQLNSMVHD